jgi:hypothetical protein
MIPTLSWAGTAATQRYWFSTVSALLKDADRVRGVRLVFVQGYGADAAAA